MGAISNEKTKVHMETGRFTYLEGCGVFEGRGHWGSREEKKEIKPQHLNIE